MSFVCTCERERFLKGLPVYHSGRGLGGGGGHVRNGLMEVLPAGPFPSPHLEQ